MTRRTFLQIVAVVTMMLVWPGTVRAGTALDRNEIAELFRQGNELFHEANDLQAQDPVRARDLYHQAAMRFERIAGDGGVHNGKLYYNIANAYFKMKDLGRAILNYRRAELLTPDDPNLRQNLAYARSKRLDKIPDRQEKKVLRTLFFWHYDLSTRTRTVLFGLCFVGFWGLVTIRLVVNKAARIWPRIVSGGVALILLGSLGIEAWSRSHKIAGVVLASEVTARKGDGETYQPSFKDPLHAGAEFDLLENRGEWYHVALADGRPCWVPARAVGLIR